jgi:hypothetical protein
VLDGTGVVTIDGAARPHRAWCPRSFVPRRALHSVRCTGAVDLRIAYAFAADSFEQIEYVFAPVKRTWGRRSSDARDHPLGRRGAGSTVPGSSSRRGPAPP